MANNDFARPPSISACDPSARRLAIEDNIEARYSVVHRRNPASAKAGDGFKPKCAIV
jgi:hypothetical protein